MISKPDEGTGLMAVMWIDRDRRYFISTTGTTNQGKPFVPQRHKRTQEGTSLEEVTVNIPQVCETYHDTCAAIDDYNRCSQDDPGLEKTFDVKDWFYRANTSLLSIFIVDAWKLYVVVIVNSSKMTQHQFYSKLAEGLMENELEAMTMRQRDSDISSEDTLSAVGSGLGTHLAPTGSKRKKADWRMTSASYQSRCPL